MHFNSLPLVNVAWGDIERFCEQQVTEGTSLDYKRTFPNDLERTVAAMANTLGGLILIGVADDGEGKPVLPISGLPPERGMAERILSICAANINPPVVPRVEIITDVDGKRAVALVRLPQSHEAPHAIASNTRVYVRTGQRNDPDELANLERLQWMMNRRVRSEEFREWLIARATARFVTAAKGLVPSISPTKEPNMNGLQLPCLLTLYIVPCYPDVQPLVLPKQLDGLRRNIVVRDGMGTAHQFPIQESPAVARLVEDGVVMHVSGGSALRTYHTHLNMHGLYFYKQSLLYELTTGRGKDGKDQKVAVMRLSEIVERTIAMLETGHKLYTHLNYFGPVRVALRLENVLKWPLMITARSDYGERMLRYSTDPDIQVIEVASADQLMSQKEAICHRLVRRVGWAFDYDISVEEIPSLRPR